MLKYLTFIAPIVLKAPRKNPVQVMVLFTAMGLLLALGSLAILIGIWTAIFRFAGETYIAWSVVGLLLLLGAFAIYFFLLKVPEKPRVDLPHALETDPLTELLPDQLTNDPTVAKLLKQISEHPFGSIATAIIAGTLIGQEVLGRDKAQVVMRAAE